jgi:hypothetical protein
MPETTTEISPWEAVIDRLEADVATAVTALDDPGAPFDVQLWVPPKDLGPLPQHLAPRARDVLAAQRDVAARLMKLQKHTGKQIDAISAVPEIPAKAVYVDVTG